MTTKILFPPTKEILKAADAIQDGIGKFLVVKESFDPDLFYTYESSRYGLIHLVYIVRCIESVLALAKTDLVLLPGARALTRTVLEVAIRHLWMLGSDDQFEREARCLRLSDGIERFWRLERGKGPISGVEEDAADKYETAQEYFETIRRKLDNQFPNKYDTTKKPPSNEEMCTEIDQDQKYGLYKELSQYTHGIHLRTEIYHTGYGAGHQFVEQVSGHDWFTPLGVCWESFCDAANRWLPLVGVNSDEFVDKRYAAMMAMTLINI